MGDSPRSIKITVNTKASMVPMTARIHPASGPYFKFPCDPMKEVQPGLALHVLGLFVSESTAEGREPKKRTQMPKHIGMKPVEDRMGQ